MKKGIIYKITNPNNKIYIGQTINFKKRMSRYKFYDCKGQKKLYNSLNKYGWENHTVEIIDEVWQGYNNEILNIRERYWINEFNSYFEGLNSTTGGDTKFNQTSHNKGKTFSDQTKKKMSESMKGNKNGKANKGRVITDEQKKRISDTLLKKQNKININGVEYSSIRQASIILKISYSTLSRKIKNNLIIWHKCS